MAEWRPSDADRRLIQQMLTRDKRRPPSHPAGREGMVEHEEWLAPEVHVARVPHGGIPPLDEGSTGTGTGTWTEDDVPGSAVCEIYELAPSPDYTGTGTSSADLIGLTWTLRRVPGRQRRVFNIGTAWIAGDRWVAVVRDKTGSWLAMSPAGAAQVTTDVPPCSAAPSFSSYRYYCEATTGTGGGDLNEYRVTFSVTKDAEGCMTFVEGEEEFVRTVACCDPSCETTEDTGNGEQFFSVPCCSGVSLPDTLHATVTNNLNCACAGGTSFALTRGGDPTYPTFWHGSSAVGTCGKTLEVWLCVHDSPTACVRLNWKWADNCGTPNLPVADCSFGATAPTSCSPFQVSRVIDATTCCGGAPGQVNLLVTL